jgi:hypothetical protein
MRMREVCNLGYGRSCCERFPSASTADAVRFHIAKDSGGLIQIQYVFERDCWPGEHGAIEWSAERRFSPDMGNDVLRRQAEAFLESYLRRRGGA